MSCSPRVPMGDGGSLRWYFLYLKKMPQTKLPSWAGKESLLVSFARFLPTEFFFKSPGPGDVRELGSNVSRPHWVLLLIKIVK